MRWVAALGLGALALGSLASTWFVPAALAAGPQVTVYARDLAYVRESRTLDAGDTVRINDLPERLDFTSVRLVPEGGVKVRRLAYRYDLASGDGLLEEARGSRVRVVLRDDRVTEGTLLALDGSWLVVRTNDGTVSTLARAAVEDVRLSGAASDLRLRPTIEAVLDGARRGRLQATLAYLTGGLSWSAEHTLVKNDEGSGQWSAVVTVDNHSGRDYRDADLKLVAGDPRRVSPPPMPYAKGEVMMRTQAVQADGVDLSEQTFSEYHLYTLDRPATLRDRESQSLTMLEPRPVKLTPRYLYRGGVGVTAQLEVRNTKAEGPGAPLPAGRVRFYEKDPAGDLQFTGETQIRHTPEGEKLTLDVGLAFDLVGERREVASRRISDRERELEVEVKLRNQKKTPVVIIVAENVPGDFELLRKSHDVVRKDAHTLEFSVPVAAGKEAVLTYAVRVRY
ncbi:MAG TPA: DUF4139 domain-containing protein [Candidatus Limnocylindria bacterium]|nr:DUF4139 domain-containing protein [Candidatus Limnocylindria bacterium]